MISIQHFGDSDSLLFLTKFFEKSRNLRNMSTTCTKTWLIYKHIHYTYTSTLIIYRFCDTVLYSAWELLESISIHMHFRYRVNSLRTDKNHTILWIVDRYTKRLAKHVFTHDEESFWLTRSIFVTRFYKSHTLFLSAPHSSYRVKCARNGKNLVNSEGSRESMIISRKSPDITECATNIYYKHRDYIRDVSYT